MPKAYAVVTYRSVSDPEKLAMPPLRLVGQAEAAPETLCIGLAKRWQAINSFRPEQGPLL